MKPITVNVPEKDALITQFCFNKTSDGIPCIEAIASSPENARRIERTLKGYLKLFSVGDNTDYALKVESLASQSVTLKGDIGKALEVCRDAELISNFAYDLLLSEDDAKIVSLIQEGKACTSVQQKETLAEIAVELNPMEDEQLSQQLNDLAQTLKTKNPDIQLNYLKRLASSLDLGSEYNISISPKRAQILPIKS